LFEASPIQYERQYYINWLIIPPVYEKLHGHSKSEAVAKSDYPEIDLIVVRMNAVIFPVKESSVRRAALTTIAVKLVTVFIKKPLFSTILFSAPGYRPDNRGKE